MANPLNYNELFDFSNSGDIKEAIKLLEKLEQAYGTLIKEAESKSGIFEKSLQAIRKESESLIKKIEPLNINIDEQRQALNKAANEAENLAQKERELKKAQEDQLKQSKVLEGELEKIRKAREKTNKALIEDRLARQESNQVAKQQVIIARSQEGSIERLRAELALATMAWKKLSTEERENTEEGRKLVTTKLKLTNQLKDLEKQTGDTRRNVGNYSDALKEAAESSGGLLASLQGGGAGAGQGLAGLLGKAGPLAGAAAIIGGLGIAFDSLSDEIAEVNRDQRLAAKLTGLQGNELKELTANVRATSKVFGKEYNETLKASNVLMKSFGITQSEAIDEINELLVRGADINEDFLDQISEYSVQFEAAGLSAGNLVEVLLASEQAGIFSDKGADTIKEASLRLRELTPAAQDALKPLGKLANEQIRAAINAGKTFDAIKLVSTGLSEVNLTAQQTQTIIADVFGGPGEDAGLEFIKSLKDVGDATEDYRKNLTATQKAQLDYLDSQKELESELTNLAGNFEGVGFTLQEFWNDIKTTGVQALNSLILAFTNVEDRFDNFFKQVQKSKDITLLRQELKKLEEDLKAQEESGITAARALRIGQDAFLSYVNEVRKGNLSQLFDKESEASKRVTKEISDSVNEKKRQIEVVQKRIEEILAEETEARKEEAEKQAAAEDEAAKKALKARKIREREALLARLAAQDELNKLLLQREIDNIELQLDALSKGSEQKVELLLQEQERLIKIAEINTQARLRELDNERQEVVANTELSEKERAEKIREINIQIRTAREEFANEQIAIERKINEGVEKVLEERIEILAEEFDKRQAIIDTKSNDEQRLLIDKYNEGVITYEEYQKQLTDIQEKFLKERLQDELKFLEEQLAKADLTEKQRLELERDISKVRLELSEATVKEIAENEDQLKEKIKEIGQSILDFGQELFEQRQERQLEQQDAELERLTEEKDQKLAVVQDDAQARAFIEEEFAKKQEEIEKQKAQIQRRQAIFAKVRNAAEAGINTARAVTSVLPNIPLSIAIGAFGALQVARILSTPIPGFWKGTKNSPEGFAWVGERGQELVEPKGGTPYLTGNKKELTYLPKGSIVHTKDETKKIAENWKETHEGMAGQSFVNYMNDSNNKIQKVNKEQRNYELLLAMERNGDRVAGAIKQLPQDVYDEKGYRRYERGVSGRVRRIDNYNKLHK